MEATKIQVLLEVVRKKHDGILSPTAVVEAARPTNSALHSRFEWDDGKASEQYRLWQARQLISLVITAVKPETREYDVHTYISLRADRNADGGYRLITDVLANKDMRIQMVTDAFAELRTFRAKYGQLRELAQIFRAMDEMEKVVA